MLHGGRGGVWAAVLAAGLSRRMGRPKPLLDWEGEPLVWRALRAALAVEALARVLLVLGYRAGMVLDALAREGLRDPRLAVRVNPGFRRGMGTSVALAAREALAGGAEALVLVPCDVPFLDEGCLHRVLAVWKAAQVRARAPLAVRSRAAGRPAHPVLLGPPLLARAVGLRGDAGMRPLLGRLGAGAVLWVEQPPEVALDVDTPGDYRKALLARSGRAADSGGTLSGPGEPTLPIAGTGTPPGTGTR